MAEARQTMIEARAPWAVVVGGDGRLRGWVAADTASEGTAGEVAQRLPAWVDKHANLKQAFAEMLQQDAGWVAVLDGSRYLGVLTPESLHAALRRSIAEQDG
jgi:osmoprotectant transport system ATP-binding protein